MFKAVRVAIVVALASTSVTVGSSAVASATQPPRVARAASSPTATSPAPTPASREGAIKSAQAQAKASGARQVVDALTTAYSTTYAQPDGTMLTNTSVTPVHFWKNGAWRDVDNTLQVSASGVAPKSNPVGLGLSRGNDKHLLSLTAGGHRVAVDWRKTLPAPTVDGPSATYTNVEPGVDLQVNAGANRVEFNVVLTDRPAGALAPILVPVTASGLTATSARGGVDFTDASGTRVGRVPPAFEYDARGLGLPGGPGQGDATLQAIVQDGQSYIQIDPDNAFLQDPTTQYPVTIDPYYAETQPMADTYIDSHNPTNSYDSAPYLLAGYNGVGVYRTMLKFLNTSIYSGHVINAANLGIYNWLNSNCNTTSQVRAYEAGDYSDSGHGYWDGNATWNSAHGLATRAIVGAAKLSGCTAGYQFVSVTQAVTDWSTYSNQGLILAANNEADSTSGREYWSSSYDGSCSTCFGGQQFNMNYTPFLAVSWQDVPSAPTGVSGTSGDNFITATWNAVVDAAGQQWGPNYPTNPWDPTWATTGDDLNSTFTYTATAYDTATGAAAGSCAYTASETSQPAQESCTISGATHPINGRSYRLAVHASNLRGTGPDGNSTSNVFPAGRPGVPANVTADKVSGTTAINDGYIVSWDSVSANGSTAGVSKYYVRTYVCPTNAQGNPGTCSIDSQTPTVTVTANGTGRQHSPTITPHLSGGATAHLVYYAFDVAADNTSASQSFTGVGTYSATTAATQNYGVTLFSPGPVTATAGNRTATVTWSPSALDAAAYAVTSYTVTGYTSGDNVARPRITVTVPAGTVPTNLATSPYYSVTVSNVVNGLPVYWIVTASNSSGTGSDSAQTNAVLAGTTGAVTAPDAEAAGEAIDFTWQAPEGAARVTGYQIDCYDQASDYQVGLRDSLPATATSDHFDLAGYGIEYWSCYLGAVTSTGEGPVHAFDAIEPELPSRPTRLSARADSTSSLTIAWKASHANGTTITGYNVSLYQTSIEYAATQTIFAAGAGDGSATFTGLTPSQNYAITVCAQTNADGNPCGQDSQVLNVSSADLYQTTNGNSSCPTPSGSLWGYDTTSIFNSTFKQTVDSAKGTDFQNPKILGRYLGTTPGISDGLTEDEIRYAHSLCMGLMLVQNHTGTHDELGATRGAGAAKDAITQASALAAPAGTPLLMDVECCGSTGTQIDADFIKTFVSTVKQDPSGYVPGFYTNTLPNSGPFIAAYCSARSSDPSTYDALPLWTTQPNQGETSSTNAPDISQATPLTCGGSSHPAQIFQYWTNNVPQYANIDEDVASSQFPFWR